MIGRVTYVQVNGVELEYVDEGRGVPVVFSHGGGSDVRYWEPQREVFAARYRFVGYSHRSHGTPPWPAQGDYSADAHTADLVAIIRRLEAGPVHLVGFSAAIALRATLREPGLVRSLTVVEPNVPWLLEGSPLSCAQLGAITAPTLVLGAEHGMPYSRRIVDVLAGCISGSRVVVVPAVTHFMSYQEPEVFNEVVLDFLARH
jgi:pimeloyl-ACP methyl ester carboxylesterase